MRDPFKIGLMAVLVLLGMFLLVQGEEVQQSGEGLEVHFFFSPTCPHCQEQKPFNQVLEDKYPISIVSHDVTSQDELGTLMRYAQEHGLESSKLGVPMTFVNGNYITGFDSVEITGKRLESMIVAALEGRNVTQAAEQRETLNVPFLGEISIQEYSLPMLAIVLGLVDGFNPCAMWALVFLISLILGMADRKKMMLLVGSFVFASGVLYFLFMTAWLNVFLFIGFFRPITVIIGLVALYAAVNDLKDFFTKGPLTCPVGSPQQKGKVMGKMKQLVAAPLTWGTFAGIVALAFVVNSIEFVCSSAIPAVFTQTLALQDLSAFSYYGLILLYDLFFMLDDLVIFSLAAFAVTHVGDRYAKWCKLVGGMVLLVLGIMLLFAPHLLR